MRLKTYRQLIEEKFHDHSAKLFDISGVEPQKYFLSPGNPENKYVLSCMGDVRHKKILDLGCGIGESVVFFALQDAEVIGVDISSETVRVAESLIKKYKTERNASVFKMVVENLEFEDETFDLVYGNGVLHHVDIDATSKEIARVLKPGGKAIFIEPLSYNPLIKVYRYFIGTSNRTPVELPLDFNQVNHLNKYFYKVTHREFQLFTLLIFLYFFFIKRSDPRKERYWKKIIYEGYNYESTLSRLQKIDNYILERFPILRRLCWNTVLVLEKKK